MIESIQRSLRAIAQVIQKPHYAALLVAIAVPLWVVYAVLTNLIILDGTINPLIKPLDAILISVMVILTSLLLTLLWFQAKNGQSTTGKKGLVGSFLGLFSSACLICQPVWLFWIGFSSAGAVLVQQSTAIEWVSIGFLIIGLIEMGKGIEKCTWRKSK